MTTLNGLADEVLSQIFSLSSLDVVTLWTSGDPLMRMRISRCSLDIKTSSSLRRSILKKWPQMFSQLSSLCSLFIQVDMFDEHISLIAAKLKTLPSTVTHLWLQFRLASVLPFGDKLSDLTAPINDLAVYSSEADAPICWNISHYFPHLRKAGFLESYKPPNRSVIIPQLFPSYFGVFPANLEELHWNGLFSGNHDFSQLPVGLTSLNFVTQQFATLDAKSLSTLSLPNLTELNGFKSDGTIESLRSLPRTLRIGHFLSFPTNLTPELLAAIPPCLESINGPSSISLPSFEALGMAWQSALPQSLTELDLSFPAPFNPTSLAMLPRTLTKLTRVTIDFVSMMTMSLGEGPAATLSCWPPNLSTIWFNIRVPLETGDLFSVPPSITDMRLRMEYRGVGSLDSFLDRFPRLAGFHAIVTNCDRISVHSPMTQSLRSLTLYSCSMNWNHFSNLPQGLTRLCLPHC